MDIERKLLWYRYSESEPERHYWNILIINTPKIIKSLWQRIYRELTPPVEDTTVSFDSIVSNNLIDEGKIRKSGGLHYEFRCLEATVAHIDFSKVYRGKVNKKGDRRLEPRESPEGWFDFRDKISRGEI